eukprot:353868_1
MQYDDKGTRLRVEECIAIQLERPTMIRLSSNGLHGSCPMFIRLSCIHIFTRLRANPFGYNYRAIHCSYLDPFTVTHLTSFAVNPYRIGASKSACSVDNSLVFSAVDSLGMALPFNCKHTHILRRAFGFNMYGSVHMDLTPCTWFPSIRFAKHDQQCSNVYSSETQGIHL